MGVWIAILNEGTSDEHTTFSGFNIGKQYWQQEDLDMLSR